jgi:predicted nuclease of predicted toxin-antitoxin system
MPHDTFEFWIDLNLPPKMAVWLTENFNVTAKSFKELHFEITPDAEVYKIAAKHRNIVVITTKDVDFKNLQSVIGSPPKILYLNTGNITNENLKKLILAKFSVVLALFSESENNFIEISSL